MAENVKPGGERLMSQVRRSGGRGATKIDHGYEVDPEHPEVKIFNVADTTVIRWHENEIGATNQAWWFYDVQEYSKWFTAGCVSVLMPGESCAFHSHFDSTEGAYECWYLTMKGTGQIRTEYFDIDLPEFSCAFMPTNSAHQFRNNSSEPVWWFTLSSRGGMPMKVNTYELECSEARPGYMEEFNRIMEARRERGLPTP